MKQWLSVNILSSDDLFREETMPIDDKEFYISLGMVAGALLLFGLLVHFLGA
jgi:hypothetical protein